MNSRKSFHSAIDDNSKRSKRREPKITASKVFELTSQIPRGRVSTYAAIASALNSGGYRAVGQILKRNPTPIDVPCHRVVKSDGSIGGYGGASGFSKKIELLKSEGLKIDGTTILDFEQVLYSDFRVGRISRVKSPRILRS